MVKQSYIIVDSFSAGLDDLSAKQQRSTFEVLKALAQTKRFSVFEATANDRIARTMDSIFASKYVQSTGGAFPWTNVEITESGRALLTKEKPHA